MECARWDEIFLVGLGEMRCAQWDEIIRCAWWDKMFSVELNALDEIRFFFFFGIQLKPLRQPVRPICGLMLLYRSIFLISYIVGPYRASVAAGTPFSALPKRWCSLPEAYGLLIKCNGLELVD